MSSLILSRGFLSVIAEGSIMDYVWIVRDVNNRIVAVYDSDESAMTDMQLRPIGEGNFTDGKRDYTLFCCIVELEPVNRMCPNCKQIKGVGRNAPSHECITCSKCGGTWLLYKWN